jgi:hypothetical protein
MPVPGLDPNTGCAEVILPDGRRMYLFEAIALDPGPCSVKHIWLFMVKT